MAGNIIDTFDCWKTCQLSTGHLLLRRWPRLRVSGKYNIKDWVIIEIESITEYCDWRVYNCQHGFNIRDTEKSKWLGKHSFNVPRIYQLLFLTTSSVPSLWLQFPKQPVMSILCRPNIGSISQCHLHVEMLAFHNGPMSR